MKILITGVPGSGKTSISKELSKLLKLSYFDVKQIIKENPETIDGKEMDELIINEKLKKVLTKILPKKCIYETHLIEYCPKNDLIIILRVKPLVLKNRLIKRGYSKQKIIDNLEVEILDYFTQIIKSNKVIEYDCSKGSAKINAYKIKRLVLAKKYNKGKIKHELAEIKKALF
jgi:adenylate kinase